MQSLFLTAIGEARDKGARALEAFAYDYDDEASALERFHVHKTIFPRDFLADFGFVTHARAGPRRAAAPRARRARAGRRGQARARAARRARRVRPGARAAASLERSARRRALTSSGTTSCSPDSGAASSAATAPRLPSSAHTITVGPEPESVAPSAPGRQVGADLAEVRRVRQRDTARAAGRRARRRRAALVRGERRAEQRRAHDAEDGIDRAAPRPAARSATRRCSRASPGIDRDRRSRAGRRRCARRGRRT